MYPFIIFYSIALRKSQKRVRYDSSKRLQKVKQYFFFYFYVVETRFSNTKKKPLPTTVQVCHTIRRSSMRYHVKSVLPWTRKPLFGLFSCAPGLRRANLSCAVCFTVQWCYFGAVHSTYDTHKLCWLLLRCRSSFAPLIALTKVVLKALRPFI